MAIGRANRWQWAWHTDGDRQGKPIAISRANRWRSAGQTDDDRQGKPMAIGRMAIGRANRWTDGDRQGKPIAISRTNRWRSAGQTDGDRQHPGSVWHPVDREGRAGYAAGQWAPRGPLPAFERRRGARAREERGRQVGEATRASSAARGTTCRGLGRGSRHSSCIGSGANCRGLERVMASSIMHREHTLNAALIAGATEG